MGAGAYPPRTIVEVARLNQDDIVEVEGTSTLRQKSRASARTGRLGEIPSWVIYIRSTGGP